MFVLVVLRCVSARTIEGWQDMWCEVEVHSGFAHVEVKDFDAIREAKIMCTAKHPSVARGR